MNAPRSRSRLALLMDFENLILGLDNNGVGLENPFSIADIIGYLEDTYGPVIYRKAFADWGNSKFRRFAVELQRMGVEMQHVVRTGINAKNAADMFLVIQAMDCMLTYPDIDVFVIVTGDGDFMPLLTKLRAAGKRSIVLATRGAIAGTLVENADEFLCYGPDGLFPVPQFHGNTVGLRRTIREILQTAGGPMSLGKLESAIRRQLPDVLPAKMPEQQLLHFLQALVPGIAVQTRGRQASVELREGGEAEAPAPANGNNGAVAQKIEDFGEYMRNTRGFIADPIRREEVIEDVYGILKTRGEDGLTIGELRDLVDPDAEIEDSEWFGTVFSMTCGGCVWEDPSTGNQPSVNRQIRLYRGVDSLEEFRIRYYASLFYKAYGERDDISAKACSELLFPNRAEEQLEFFETVLERLSERHSSQGGEREHS